LIYRLSFPVNAIEAKRIPPHSNNAASGKPGLPLPPIQCGNAVAMAAKKKNGQLTAARIRNSNRVPDGLGESFIGACPRGLRQEIVLTFDDPQPRIDTIHSFAKVMPP
jgi:hypothetical protein